MTEIKSTIFRNTRKLKALNKSTGAQRLNSCENWVPPKHCKDKIRVPSSISLKIKQVTFHFIQKLLYGKILHYKVRKKTWQLRPLLPDDLQQLHKNIPIILFKPTPKHLLPPKKKHAAEANATFYPTWAFKTTGEPWNMIQNKIVFLRNRAPRFFTLLLGFCFWGTTEVEARETKRLIYDLKQSRLALFALHEYP